MQNVQQSAFIIGRFAIRACVALCFGGLAGCVGVNEKAVPQVDRFGIFLANNAERMKESVQFMAHAEGQNKLVTPPAPDRPATGSVQAPYPQPAAVPAPRIVSSEAHRAKQKAAEAPAEKGMPNNAVGNVQAPKVGSSTLPMDFVPPVELSQPIDLSRRRDAADVILKRLCRQIGWNYGKSEGVEISPIIITVEAKNRPLYEVLKDIGAQLGRNADLRVSTETKTLSLIYVVR